MNNHTPSLDEAREKYGWTGHDSYVESNRKVKEAEFDRMIAKVRAEAKAEALRAAADNLEAVIMGTRTASQRLRTYADKLVTE